MTDIAERLHEAVAHIVCEDGCDLDKVMADAADEIERLQARPADAAAIEELRRDFPDLFTRAV